MNSNSPSFGLHDDIVYEIFKFLSLTERKNARRVSKQWHRVSNRRVFAKNEAFFISNMYEVRTVVEVLGKCQQKILNLKFDQRLFGKDSKILWNKLGRRIESLEFYMCRFPPAIFKQIFVYCKNLKEFSACGGGIVGIYDFSENLPHKKSILQIGDDVVRPNLRILHLESTALSLRACDLHLISSAFPQLTSLKIELILKDDEDNLNFLNLEVLLSLLDNKLNNLEKLHVRFPYYFGDEPIDFTSVSQINVNRLKSVSMSLKPFILKGDSFNKILHYKFWTSLEVTSLYESDADLTVVTRLLNANPLLEELRLFLVLSSISHFSDLFEALVKSRLKSLKVETTDNGWSRNFSKLFISEATVSLKKKPCNDTVEYLSIHSHSSAEFSSLFVKYFRNVRDLTVRPGDVYIVFKYQTNIKSLKIEPLDMLRTDEVPVHSSIKSLELMDTRPLLLDVFTTYQFPNLKYLIINESEVYYQKIQRIMNGGLIAPTDPDTNEENGNNVNSQNNFEGKTSIDSSIFIQKINTLMLSMFRKSPHLEAIEFDSDYYLDAEAFTVFFQSCLHFHQFRYVSFYCRSHLIDETALKREVVNYFKKCPSFRGLWFQTRKFNIFFYFNIVTKKYEFSNKLSNDHYSENLFFNTYLNEFWRNKR